MVDSIKLLGFIIFFMLQWTSNVEGRWGDPPVLAMPDPFRNITIEPIDSVINVYVAENVGDPKGFALFYLNIPDATNRPILSTGPSQYFSLKECGTLGDIANAWCFNVSAPFDYDILPENANIFFVRLQDGDDSVVKNFYVHVLNENDNRPIITVDPPLDKLEPIQELQVGQVSILTITGEDGDAKDILSGDVQEIGGQIDDLFVLEELSPKEWQLRTNKPLNYTERNSHRLNLTLLDNGWPELGASIVVTVLVDDIPNTPPEFTRTPPVTRISEHTSPGTAVASIQARDGDYGLNWKIEYSIVENTDPLGWFTINKDTGDIRVGGDIDAENDEINSNDPTYKFKVKAAEVCVPSANIKCEELTPAEMESTYEVEVIVVDIDDQLPRFCSDKSQDAKTCSEETKAFTIEIDETLPARSDTDVLGVNTIRLVDLDSTPSFNQFTAAFSTGTDDRIKAAFQISPQSGRQDETFAILVNTPSALDFDDEPFWRDEDGNPKPQTFDVIFTGKNTPSHTATANFTATVKDANDNGPKFDLDDQYEFLVCENGKKDAPLKILVMTEAGDGNANSCESYRESDEDVKVSATDLDASPNFGNRSIIYRWSNSKEPPITLDETTGTMTISSDENFDYERYKDETFYVEAADMYGDSTESLATTKAVLFKILDVNDETPDIKFRNGTRGNITEEENPGGTVLNGISISDPDVDADLSISMTISDNFFRSVRLRAGPQADDDCDEDNLAAKMKEWFKLVKDTDTSWGANMYKIVIGEEDSLPDREGYGCNNFDKVDLTITAKDLKQKTGEDSVTVIIPVTINDKNDNPPEGEGESVITVNVVETETPAEDTVDLYTLRVKDKDKNPQFNFTLRNDECKNELEPEICEKILNMFEISPVSSSLGQTQLFRKKGALIDRDDRTYFAEDNIDDMLRLTIHASDGNWTHNYVTTVNIEVKDINDNTPKISEDYPSNDYPIPENDETAMLIDTIYATDDDKPDLFGNVSYLLLDSDVNNCVTKCACLDRVTGKLTASPDPEAYAWSISRPSCSLVIQARDYYREYSSSGSNWSNTTLTITIIDENDHKPEFETDDGNPLKRFPERESMNVTIQVKDEDNPDLGNGEFSVTIEKVVRDPPDENALGYFSLDVPLRGDPLNNRKDVHFLSENMTGRCGTYEITLKACDFWGADNAEDNQKCDSRLYHVVVDNENLNYPEFTYPEENEIVRIPIEDVVVGDPIPIKEGGSMPNIHAEDKDAGCCCGNGDVSYSIVGSNIDDCTSKYYQLFPDTGLLTFKNKPDEATDSNLQCELELEARDHGSTPKETRRKITLVLLPKQNTPPSFEHPDPVRVIKIQIRENATNEDEAGSEECTKCGAIDKDIIYGNLFDPGTNSIYHTLRGGHSDLFDIVPYNSTESGGNLVLRPKPGQVIDREMYGAVEGQFLFLNVSIYATNYDQDPEPPKSPSDITVEDKQWAVVQVQVDDVLDTPPEFRKKSIMAGFSTSNKAGESIADVVTVDLDYNDDVTVTISSDVRVSNPDLPNQAERPPFKLEKVEPNKNEHTTKIIIQFDPQPSFKGYYTFNLTATDSVNMTEEVECKIYAVANENIVKFYFNNKLEDLQAKTARAAEILSDAFNFPCNVERAFMDAGVNNLVTLATHFINPAANEPVSAQEIEGQQFDPDFYNSLSYNLSTVDLKLHGIGESQELNESDFGQIMTYVLIGAVAVLTIALLIMSASCFYNNRSLALQVRALTANTFGSQQSDLNRLGVHDAPNTNAFTAEGSNPVWATSTGFESRGIPDFDTDSVGSGGSVLIGAEDEDYFQSSLRNPGAFQANDVVANFDNESYNDAASQDGSAAAANESPFSPRITKNPLLSLGASQLSVDVDADNFGGDETYQFEGNTDANLF